MKKTGRRSKNIQDKRHDITVNIPDGTPRRKAKELRNSEKNQSSVNRTYVKYAVKKGRSDEEAFQALKSQNGPRDLGILTKKRVKEKLKKMSKTYMDFVNKK